MTYFRPSGVGLAQACSGYIKQSHNAPEQSNEYTQSGVKIHKATETGKDDELDEEEREVAESARLYIAEHFNPLGADLYEHELPLPPIEGIFDHGGTCDLVGVWPVDAKWKREGRILDLKTGYEKPQPTHIYGQMVAYWVSVLEIDESFREIPWEVHVHCPRFGFSDTLHFWARRDYKDAVAFLAEVRAQTESEIVTLSPGLHCRHCPGSGTCPAVTSKVMEVAQERVAALPMERCEELYLLKKPLEDVLEQLKKRIKGALLEGADSEHFRLVQQKARTAIDTSRYPDVYNALSHHQVKASEIYDSLKLSYTAATKLLTNLGHDKKKAQEILAPFVVEGKQPEPQLRRK